ncbi:MAG: GNAT family N-acetyltransferase [Pseudomonadota bacterium]
MNLKKIIYREDAFPSDIQNVREIVESSRFFSEDEVEIAVELLKERLLKDVSSGYYFLFVEHSRKVIGYACFGPIPGTKWSYEIYWIAVHNDFRGLGMGKEILQRVERKIKAMEGKRIYVETSSREQYKPTHSFYENCGYKKESILQDFYAPGDDKVIYVKVCSSP